MRCGPSTLWVMGYAGTDPAVFDAARETAELIGMVPIRRCRGTRRRPVTRHESQTSSASTPTGSSRECPGRQRSSNCATSRTCY